MSLKPVGSQAKLEAFYAPTRDEVVDCMLAEAAVCERDTLVDLGSGDGRFVIAAAKRRRARAIGIEIDPRRVDESREKARAARVGQRARFVQGDLFAADLSEATVVTLYLVPTMTARLTPKLLRELRPGARVVSHDFPLRSWRPDNVIELGRSLIYQWIVPARVAGVWTVHIGESGGRPAKLRLRQRYQRVDGTIERHGRCTALTEVSLRGSELGFTVPRAGRWAPLRFTCRASDARLDGHVSGDGDTQAARPVTATRVGRWR